MLGRLKGVQPLEQIMVRGQDLTDKKEFIIENIRFAILFSCIYQLHTFFLRLQISFRGEELRITLWGDVAKRFNDSDLANQSSPLIIVFAGFRITEFKGFSHIPFPFNFSSFNH